MAPDATVLVGYTGAPEDVTLPDLLPDSVGWSVFLTLRGGRGGSPDLVSYRAAQVIRFVNFSVSEADLEDPFLVQVGQDATHGRDARGGPSSRSGGWPNGGDGGEGPGSVLWNRDGYGGGGSTSVHFRGALVGMAAGGGGWSGQSGSAAGYQEPGNVLFRAGAYREWGGAVYNPPSPGLGIGQSGGPAGFDPADVPAGTAPGGNGTFTAGTAIGRGGDGGSPADGVGGGGGGGGSGTFYDGRRGGGGGAGGAPGFDSSGTYWYGGGYGPGNLYNAPSSSAGDNVQGDDGFARFDLYSIIPPESEAGWLVGAIGLGV